MSEKVEMVVCDECGGEGQVLVMRGYTITGWGYGDCHENEYMEECEKCGGEGEVEVEPDGE